MSKDTIYRQAAIDALVKAIREDPYYDSNERINGLGVCDVRVIINDLPSAQPEPRWIPCSERLPEEDHWLGGSGKQFSEQVLVTIANHDDDDIWVYVANTIDGEWILDLPRHCEVIAWMPLPEPYAERRTDAER